jgi:hypothetical protein
VRFSGSSGSFPETPRRSRRIPLCSAISTVAPVSQPHQTMMSLTRAYVRSFAAVVAISGMFACSKTPVAGTSPASGATGPLVSANPRPGTVAGVLPINGAVKQGQGIVVLQSLERVASAPPLEIPVLDLQAGDVFLPPVLLLHPGQSVEFRNHDARSHNIAVKDTEMRLQLFNVVVPAGGLYTFKLDHDGFYDVVCDAEQSIRAVILAARSPYETLTRRDGTFRFDDVEPGLYSLRGYAGAEEVTRTIAVASGANTEIDLSHLDDMP